MTDDRHQALADNLPVLLRFARSLTRDLTAADDLVQDTVVRALERHSQFDGRRKYRTWLLALSHNLFVDGWRRTKVLQRIQPHIEASSADSIQPVQEHAAILRETLRTFDSLPEDQRAVLHLVVVEGSSYADAAEILGVPVGTIMSRLSRARQTLRNPRPVPRAGHLKLVSDRDG